MWKVKSGDSDKSVYFQVSVEINPVTENAENTGFFGVKSTPIFMKKIIVFFSLSNARNPVKSMVCGIFQNIVDIQKSFVRLRLATRKQHKKGGNKKSA